MEDLHTPLYHETSFPALVRAIRQILSCFGAASKPLLIVIIVHFIVISMVINMKPGEVQTYLPPPPHKIVEYLNGHIIGHYVMKKAISVAIYNHFCSINFSRLNDLKICREEALVEDAKHYFNRDNPSVAKINDVDVNFDEDNQEYMSPVVARVIIEAASHKVRLRGPNVLTFDSTGPSKPVNAICSTMAQFFDIPFIKIDCSNLSPVANVREPEVQGSPMSLRNRILRRSSSLRVGGANSNKNLEESRNLERRGSLTLLLEGCDENKETINCVISKLYRKAEFDLNKAQRGIIFLDGMDKIGSNINISALARRQALKEILQVLDGTTLDVTRAGSENTECIDTSKIFFVCFGNFEATQQTSRKTTPPNLFGHQPSKFNQSPTHSDSSSSDSGNGSGGHRSNSGANGSRRSSTQSPDQRSEGYNSDEDEYYIEGLKENKLAQQLFSDATDSIAHYQSLWGMKDVHLKFTPEALEVIANQAENQNAGKDGIVTILEKLFINLKFDLMGNDITAVEINEDVILGKKRPNYIKKPSRKKAVNRKVPLTAIDEELGSDDNVPAPSYCRARRALVRLPSRLTEYDLAIVDQIEI